MLLEFLESLGVEFEIDWDDEVIITVPREGISYAEIEQALQPVSKRLVNQARYRAKARRSVFVGGTLNGQEVESRTHGIRSEWCHRMADGKLGHRIRRRIKRGCWEVYEQGDTDGRAFFRGYATSEQKARKGQLREASRPAAGSAPSSTEPTGGAG